MSLSFFWHLFICKMEIRTIGIKCLFLDPKRYIPLIIYAEQIGYQRGSAFLYPFLWQCADYLIKNKSLSTTVPQSICMELQYTQTNKVHEEWELPAYLEPAQEVKLQGLTQRSEPFYALGILHSLWKDEMVVVQIFT